MKLGLSVPQGVQPNRGGQNQPIIHMPSRANLCASCLWCVSSTRCLLIIGTPLFDFPNSSIPISDFIFLFQPTTRVGARSLSVLGFMLFVLKFCHFFYMDSISSTPFILVTPTITSSRLNWKNYSSWFASMELWFLGQGC